MAEPLFGTSKYAKNLPPGMPADRRERYEAAETAVGQRYISRSQNDSDWIGQFVEFLAWPETPYLSDALRAQFEDAAVADPELARLRFETTVHLQPTTGTVHTIKDCSVARRSRYGTERLVLSEVVRKALEDGTYRWCRRCHS